MLTPEQALDAVRAGERVRMTVGEGGPEDPVLIVYRDEDGYIYARSVAGWSAGVLEPVCAPESDFLRCYLRGRHELELADVPT